MTPSPEEWVRGGEGSLVRASMIPARRLDDVLTLQLAVAWAGESGEAPRLGWWRTDLVSEFGGEDLFRRLLPHTWRWAVFEAVREAARRVDARSRSRDHDPDGLLSLFHLGFDADEQLEQRLADLKRGSAPPKEVQRRRRKRGQAVASLTLIEPGLWRRMPDAVWALELAVIDRQKRDFRLHAPDEARARAAFEAAHPGLAAERANRIAALRLFADAGPMDVDDDAGGDARDDLDEEQAARGEEVDA
jgi:hypothetical protein